MKTQMLQSVPTINMVISMKDKKIYTHDCIQVQLRLFHKGMWDHSSLTHFSDTLLEISLPFPLITGDEIFELAGNLFDKKRKLIIFGFKEIMKAAILLHVQKDLPLNHNGQFQGQQKIIYLNYISQKLFHDNIQEPNKFRNERKSTWVEM